jgi:hypothetical protein
MVFGQLFLCLALLVSIVMPAQNIQSSPPDKPNPDQIYLFYLHGMIVQQQGPDAVSDQYGAYEYQNILESLAESNFQVISEVRPKDTQIDAYGKKIASDISVLIDKGVPAQKIVVVGASLGAYMALEAAYLLQNKQLNFALLGLCSKKAYQYFSDRYHKPCGNFFSIYETSDFAGSCKFLFEDSTCKKGFQELALKMGNGHGFLFKAYPEWMYPLQAWIHKQ